MRKGMGGIWRQTDITDETAITNFANVVVTNFGRLDMVVTMPELSTRSTLPEIHARRHGIASSASI